MNTTVNAEPRIFITTYNLYNCGMQFASENSGFWMSTDEDLADAHEKLAQAEIELGIGDGDIEPMVTDYENFPAELYSECMGEDAIEKINQWANLSDDEQIAFEFLTDMISCDFDEALESLDCVILYKNTSGYDWAYQVINDNYDLPEFALRYFDYDAFYRDESFGNVYEYGDHIIEYSN